MKYLLFTILITFISCQKQEMEEPVMITDENEVFQTVIMQKWILINAWVYFENIETGQRTKYSHFDANKSASSMRFPYNYYPIEMLYQDSTTWEFTNVIVGNGIYEFVLNDTDTMAYNLVGNYKTIIEHPQANNQSEMHIGGSAKPITPWTEDGVKMKLIIHEAYTSIDGYNYKYFNVLEFQPY